MAHLHSVNICFQLVFFLLFLSNIVLALFAIDRNVFCYMLKCTPITIEQDELYMMQMSICKFSYNRKIYIYIYNGQNKSKMLTKSNKANKL